MNTLRHFSQKAIRRGIAKPPTQRLCSTIHHRLFQKQASPFLRRKVTLLNRHPRPSFLPSRKFGIFGGSVASPFIKSAMVFYAIPITAAASPYFNVLPFDLIYGCVLPYHAYHGMAHIVTDYFVGYLWVPRLLAIIMLLGLQNLNLQGEGISPMVRRFFVKEKLPTSKEEIQKINWFNKMK
eukprot:743366_1